MQEEEPGKQYPGLETDVPWTETIDKSTQTKLLKVLNNYVNAITLIKKERGLQVLS